MINEIDDTRSSDDRHASIQTGNVLSELHGQLHDVSELHGLALA